MREDNHRAIELYKASGYRPIGRYLDYYADHMPALRFEKVLKGIELFAERVMPRFTAAGTQAAQ